MSKTKKKSTGRVKQWLLTLLFVFLGVAVGLAAVYFIIRWDEGRSGVDFFDQYFQKVENTITKADDETSSELPEGPTTIKVPEDTSSLQGAIEMARDGDTVEVAAGTYTDTETENGISFGMMVNKAITVVGAGRGETIIDGQEKAMHGVYIPEEGVGATVRGITFTNFRNNGAEVLASNVEISESSFLDNGNRGASFVLLVGGSFHNNIVANNRFNGVYTEKSSPKIANNTIVENGPAGIIIVVADTDPKGTSPEIFNNIIVGHTSYGVLFDHPAFPEDCVIEYNNLFNNEEDYFEELNNEGTESQASAASPGTGELTVDPEFVDEESYQLGEGSLLIGAGRDGVDMGAYGEVAIPQEFDL